METETTLTSPSPSPSHPTGKAYLQYLLSKTFDAKLTSLETNTTTQLNSLNFTSKSFKEFNLTLTNLSKEQKPKPTLTPITTKPLQTKLQQQQPKPSTTKSFPRSKTSANLTLPPTKPTFQFKSLLNKKQLSTSALITQNQLNKTTVKTPGKINNFKSVEKKIVVRPFCVSTGARFFKNVRFDYAYQQRIMQKLNQSAQFGDSAEKRKQELIETIQNTRNNNKQQFKNKVQNSKNNLDKKKKQIKDSIKTTSLKKTYAPKTERLRTTNPLKKHSLPNNYFVKLKKDKWFNNILIYLNIKDQLSFTTTSRIFKQQYLFVIDSLENSINNAINLEEGETIDDRIETLETRAQEKEIQTQMYNEFYISKGSIRAIELFNGESYNKLFKIVLLDSQMKEIIIIYRILFRFLNEEAIATIENDNKFWLKCCEFLHKKGEENGIGSYLLSAANDFNFDDRNIFLISSLIAKKQVILAPSYYSKICPSTGLIMFLIKDSLEYCGIIYSDKRTPYKRMLNNALYVKTLLERVHKIKSMANVL